ncbi:polysaccharide deacetylase family protein [Paenibacillus rigui]|uniref:Polysaccharide deacetylase n=1 Tax=Paenibacillus rigui TaxID=554312 RepID=A0A229UX58_9BACL|nr:polysaccharide deacetylase family protein [Paenibacillus rigui]OXM87851.1 polysaccharide deacetylase [Paenibacillus rigui]
MNSLSLKVIILLLIGVCVVPFIGSGTPNYMYKDQVAVIMYHHLSDTAKSSVTITPKLFKEQLELLKARNYHFLTLQQFEHYMSGGAVPDNAVLVTFDDSYKSYYDIGYPILEQLGIPSVNFVITEQLTDPFGGNIPFLSNDQVAEMIAKPGNAADFECHSDRLHAQKNGQPLLTSRIGYDGNAETPEAYTKRIGEDTLACRNKLKQLHQKPVNAYAYPFGSFDQTASDILRKNGIRYAFTVVSEMATREDDPMQIPRITAGNPSISPEELHNTIMRKVVDRSRTFGYIPFRESVGQVGGTMIQDKDGTINFYYHGKHWTTRMNSSTVKLDDRQFQLTSPIQMKSRRTQILYEDLQRILGIQMVFNPVKNTFSERLTPTASPSQ